MKDVSITFYIHRYHICSVVFITIAKYSALHDWQSIGGCMDQLFVIGLIASLEKNEYKIHTEDYQLNLSFPITFFSFFHFSFFFPSSFLILKMFCAIAARIPIGNKFQDLLTL